MRWSDDSIFGYFDRHWCCKRYTASTTFKRRYQTGHGRFIIYVEKWDETKPSNATERVQFQYLLNCIKIKVYSSKSIKVDHILSCNHIQGSNLQSQSDIQSSASVIRISMCNAEAKRQKVQVLQWIRIIRARALDVYSCLFAIRFAMKSKIGVLSVVCGCAVKAQLAAFIHQLLDPLRRLIWRPFSTKFGRKNVFRYALVQAAQIVAVESNLGAITHYYHTYSQLYTLVEKETVRNRSTQTVGIENFLTETSTFDELNTV